MIVLPDSPEKQEYEAPQKPLTHQEQFLLLAQQQGHILQSVYVVIPTRPGSSCYWPLAKVLSLWTLTGTWWEPFDFGAGGFLEVARASACKQFLENTEKEHEYLLFLDDDMTPDVFLPWTLARHGKDIVAGCCMGVNADEGPMLCFTLKDQNGEWRMPKMERGEKIPKSGLVKVGHVGTGAMLIHRRVLESFTFDPDDTSEIPFYLPEHVRAKAASEGRLKRGEDIEFCRQVRRKGFDIHVDLEAHVGHKKSVEMTWMEHLRDPYMKAEEWVLPADGLKIGADDER